MKHVLFISAALFIAACGSTEKPVETAVEAEAVATGVNTYGEAISTDGAMASSQLYAAMEKTDSLPAKIKATINETCEMKGCWMIVDMGDGKEMRVRFKDYGFFVPTSGVEGKLAIMEGYAFTDTLSVDHLKHLAEDAGKTPEEIAAITEPEIGVNFEATGVIIMD